ncbi:MAG: hypothetical protein ACOX6T_11785 [Myxococcales bacterium]
MRPASRWTSAFGDPLQLRDDGVPAAGRSVVDAHAGAPLVVAPIQVASPGNEST